jgi:diguanylate cyclase (GGDEF)-like protein
VVSERAGPAASLDDVMRLLGALGLLAPVAFVSLWIGVPGAIDSLIDEGSRSIVAALAAGILGVSLTAGIVFFYIRLRLRRLIRDAERLAAGDLTVKIGSKPGDRGLEGRLGRALDGIAAALTETTNAATFDKLTGVSNRQTLLGGLFSEVERANRYGRPLSVAFVDIDHFKSVNDSYGHATGDVVLRGVAQTLKANLRASDEVGRYGGEEFMLLLPGTVLDSAVTFSERVRKRIEDHTFSFPGGTLRRTASFGVSGWPHPRIRECDSLVRAADDALYVAKEMGRNRVVRFDGPEFNSHLARKDGADARTPARSRPAAPEHGASLPG